MGPVALSTPPPGSAVSLREAGARGAKRPPRQGSSLASAGAAAHSHASRRSYGCAASSLLLLHVVLKLAAVYSCCHRVIGSGQQVIGRWSLVSARLLRACGDVCAVQQAFVYVPMVALSAWYAGS